MRDREGNDNGEDCRAILHFLKESPQAKSVELIKRALTQDLCWRIPKVRVAERAVILAEAWHQLLPDDIRAVFPASSLGIEELSQATRQQKERRDVGIVTVIGPELLAVLRAMGRLANDRPDQKSGSFSYWFGKVERVNDVPLSIVVTVVAEPRNVPAALAVAQLLRDFDVGLLLLTGICAGVRGKVGLGDVVWARVVYDYEGARLERTGPWPFWFFRRRARPREWNAPKRVLVAMQQYDPPNMHRLWKQLMQDLRSEDLPEDWSSRVPSMHSGTIAVGEKLIADGSLRRMFRRVDQEIRAGAMEDSGFAQAAEAYGVPWCIFRGVSDHADPLKGDKWRNASAVAAAAAAIIFLREQW
jgi:nucleoside phosphorylase